MECLTSWKSKKEKDFKCFSFPLGVGMKGMWYSIIQFCSGVVFRACAILYSDLFI